MREWVVFLQLVCELEYELFHPSHPCRTECGANWCQLDFDRELPFSVGGRDRAWKVPLCPNVEDSANWTSRKVKSLVCRPSLL